MSYTKVKSITFDKTKKDVTMELASSNLSPVIYEKIKCEYCSNLWKQEGLKAVEIAITLEYWTGNFQGGANKFRTKGKELEKLFPWNTKTSIVREFLIAN